MATYEHTVLHQHKDQNGDMHIDYPITKAENVDGLDTFVQTEIADLKKSVSDGKTSVANAITAKGVSTATDATFATMATNISNIPTGVDTSDATAAASDILTGKTAYVNGSKVTGSMANQGSKTASLNCGGSYTIPAGYHNGGGVITANNLASQTGATATAAQILSGYTAWANGVLLNGAASAGLKFASGALSMAEVPYKTKALSIDIPMNLSFTPSFVVLVIPENTLISCAYYNGNNYAIGQSCFLGGAFVWNSGTSFPITVPCNGTWQPTSPTASDGVSKVVIRIDEVTSSGCKLKISGANYAGCSYWGCHMSACVASYYAFGN